MSAGNVASVPGPKGVAHMLHQTSWRFVRSHSGSSEEPTNSEVYRSTEHDPRASVPRVRR